MKAILKRVSLNICSTPHYAEPCAEYKRNHPMVYHNAAIYLNNRRISGRRDYNGRVIHFTQINVTDVLKAMNIPEEIINQIQFEDENNI